MITKHISLILLLIISFICLVRNQTIESIDVSTSYQKIFLRLANGQILVGNRNLVKNFLSTGSSQTNIVYEFLSVPFAMPPTNERRFRFPVRMSKTLSLDTFFATNRRFECMQSTDDANTVNEDCLYMNMWVPVTREQDQLLFNHSNRFSNNLSGLTFIPNGFIFDRTKPNQILSESERKTTLFWIHGGSLIIGSANNPIYDGTVLASTENVIVVAPNYRLGIFGFLYLANMTVPGNAGLADQITALDWYRTNYLSYFGGRPDRVTLFGNSAGAESIQNLMFSRRNNLFNRVILQSGEALISNLEPSVILESSVQFLRAVGCTTSQTSAGFVLTNAILNCLLTRSAVNLTIEQYKFPECTFYPTIDMMGLVSQDVTDLNLIRQKQNVDVLIGFTQNEQASVLYEDYVGEYFTDQEEELLNLANDPTRYNNEFVYQRLKEFFDRSSIQYIDCLNNLYSSGNTLYHSDDYRSTLDFNLNRAENLRMNSRALAWKKLIKATSDPTYNCPSIDLADRLRSTSTKTFLYKFNKHAPYQKKWMSAAHFDEVGYVFGIMLDSEYEATAEDKLLSLNMMNYWANFAKDGIFYSKYDQRAREFFIEFGLNRTQFNLNESQERALFNNMFRMCPNIRTTCNRFL